MAELIIKSTIKTIGGKLHLLSEIITPALEISWFDNVPEIWHRREFGSKKTQFDDRSLLILTPEHKQKKVDVFNQMFFMSLLKDLKKELVKAGVDSEQADNACYYVQSQIFRVRRMIERSERFAPKPEPNTKMTEEKSPAKKEENQAVEIAKNK